jgi:hypothetical protein
MSFPCAANLRDALADRNGFSSQAVIHFRTKRLWLTLFFADPSLANGGVLVLRMKHILAAQHLRV